MKTLTRRLRKKSGGDDAAIPTDAPTAEPEPSPFAAPPVPTNIPPPSIPGRPPAPMSAPMPEQPAETKEADKPGFFAKLFSSKSDSNLSNSSNSSNDTGVLDTVKGWFVGGKNKRSKKSKKSKKSKSKKSKKSKSKK